MKKKYDDVLVKAYIMGDDIDDYDVEELENDVDFMIQAFDFSGDIKMHLYCGENVRNDYRFIRRLIDKYKTDVEKYKQNTKKCKNDVIKYENDTKFIISIVDDFLGSRKNIKEEDFDVESIELNIIMEELLKDDEDVVFKYALENNAMFNYLLIILSDEFIKQKNLGLGFGLLEQYFKSKIILDYYAKSFLEEIFYRNEDCEFEKYIHKLVKDKNEIFGDKANSFVISTVERLDSSLSWYLSCNTNLLNKIKYDLGIIYNRFDDYTKRENERKAEALIDYIEKMYKDYEICPDFTCTQLIGYTIKELSLEKEFDDDISYSRFKQSEYYNPRDYNINLAKFINKKFLNEALEKAKEIFVWDAFQDEDDYLKEFNKRRAEILKIKNQK